MKQKTLFACLAAFAAVFAFSAAAFAAVFAFSACDGFDDGSVPIDDYIRNSIWYSNKDWALTFSSDGFTLEDIWGKRYTGWYFGSVEDGGREGDVTLHVSTSSGNVEKIDSIELEYTRSGSDERLFVDEVWPYGSVVDFGSAFIRY